MGRVAALNLYNTNDTPYSTAANTETMSRFGPSGSSKDNSSVREHAKAVISSTTSAAWFEVNDIVIMSTTA